MQDIIRIPSLSSEEGAVVERIREEMLRIGYDEVTVDPMGNVIGRIGSGPKVIAFDGHVDIVDVGDPKSAIRTSGIATRIRAISRAISSTDAAQAI
jgi:acetylornithine deacetylase/succinyl-diaminopimelate desuccinylase-like protein